MPTRDDRARSETLNQISRKIIERIIMKFKTYFIECIFQMSWKHIKTKFCLNTINMLISLK